MPYFRVSPEQERAFRQDGYLHVRGLLDGEEANLLRETIERDREVEASIYERADASGAKAKLSLWTEPGDDLYGMIARSRRVVDAMERFLGDEVYHYHSKLVAKDPHVGGGFEWHQDYGYWYHNACLFPDMAACMIAIDRTDRENGCLEVLAGSHRMGRIDHVALGSQVTADPERVDEATKRLPSALIEMASVDGLFFHANLLHRSAPNRSGRRRWVLICAYNAKSNDPYKETYLPRYTPLVKVEDDRVMAAGRKGAAADKPFVRSPQGVGPKSGTAADQIAPTVRD